MKHEANTLVYVRTEAGVVQVDPGQPVPESALPEHLAVLIAKELVVEAAEELVVEAVKVPEGSAVNGTLPSGSTDTPPAKPRASKPRQGS